MNAIKEKIQAKVMAGNDAPPKESITSLAQKYSDAIKKGYDIKLLDARAETVLTENGYAIPDFVTEVMRIENENYHKHKVATLE